MELPNALLSPSSKNKKKSTPKKFLIIQEKKLPSWNFLASYFSYNSGREFLSSKNKKKPP